MGTYTTNYNLFMPSIGEQGWGDLVNGNFSTIDTTMAGLNTRLTAVENEVNGALSCTSVTTSGKITANGGIGTTTLTTSSTITSTGLITANGGIKGTLTGNATTATNLSRTVTVGYSSTLMNCSDMYIKTICPYTPGVLYTGTIRIGFYNNVASQGALYKLSSSNTWSSTDINVSAATNFSFTNCKCVMLLHNTTRYYLPYYLPTFT